MFNDTRTIQEIQANIILMQEQIVVLQKEREEARKKNEEELAALKKEREEARKKNEEELAALKKEREEAHKKLESTMDKLGFNIGMGVEEMFADGLKNNPTIHDIHFDYVHKNVEFFNDKGDTATEIDIVLVNKQSVALVETKHRFRKEDLEKFLEKQYPLFQKYGGIILRENIYLFIAGLSYDPIVIKQAQELGIGILHLKNEVIEVEGEVKNYYQ